MNTTAQDDAGWTDWFKHDGGPCPIPDAKAGEWEFKMKGSPLILTPNEPAVNYKWGVITHYRLRKPTPSPDLRALLDTAVKALREAKRALESCYQVADWPANGTTRQDDAINSINATLAIIKQKLAEVG